MRRGAGQLHRLVDLSSFAAGYFVRCPDRQKLPIVLSRKEVRRLLAAVYEPRFGVILC